MIFSDFKYINFISVIGGDKTSLNDINISQCISESENISVNLNIINNELHIKFTTDTYKRITSEPIFGLTEKEQKSILTKCKEFLVDGKSLPCGNVLNFEGSAKSEYIIKEKAKREFIPYVFRYKPTGEYVAFSDVTEPSATDNIYDASIQTYDYYGDIDVDLFVYLFSVKLNTYLKSDMLKSEDFEKVKIELKEI